MIAFYCYWPLKKRKKQAEKMQMKKKKNNPKISLRKY